MLDYTVSEDLFLDAIMKGYLMTDNLFTIGFFSDAIELLRELTPSLEHHQAIRELTKECVELDMPVLETCFQKQMATYIADRSKIFYPQDLPVYVITYESVIREINGLIRDIFFRANLTVPAEDTISNMLVGYPLQILTKVCNTNFTNAHIMGESVRRFIKIRYDFPNWLPSKMHKFVDNTIPLVNHAKSPLTDIELNALYRYLNSKKNIYIEILLGCLYELSRQQSIIDKELMNKEEIIEVCESSWLYLYLFAAMYN